MLICLVDKLQAELAADSLLLFAKLFLLQSTLGSFRVRSTTVLRAPPQIKTKNYICKYLSIKVKQLQRYGLPKIGKKVVFCYDVTYSNGRNCFLNLLADRLFEALVNCFLSFRKLGAVALTVGSAPCRIVP